MSDQKNKTGKYFFPVQFIAWTLMGAVNYMIQIAAGGDHRVVLVNALSLFFGGLFFTSLMRSFFKRNNWQDWVPLKIIATTSIVIISITIIWAIMSFGVASFTIDSFQSSAINFVAALFPLGMIVTIWTLIYFSYQLILKYHFNKINQLTLETEIQKARLGTLKSQINPHFMFNTLNNIKALMLEDVDLARKMITNFSELLGYSLRHSEKMEVSLEEELNILQKYFNLVKIQYEEKIQYDIKVNEELKTETVPPMILQLLVENGIKHGISQITEGGEIVVDISKNNSILNILVKNTGSLSQKNQLEEKLGIGQKNISERLKLIYGENAKLEMTEKPPYIYVNIKIDKK